jgi:hypothetical protein
MPSVIRNTSGGKAVSGGALAPRSRRGNTAQADAYWRGGEIPPLQIQYLVLGGGGGGGGYQQFVGFGSGGNSGQWKSSTIDENSGSCSVAESVFVPTLGTNYSVTRGGGGAGAVAGPNTGSSGSTSSFSTVSSSGGAGAGGGSLSPTVGSSASGGISCGNTTNITGSILTKGIGGVTGGGTSPASGGANTGDGGQGGGLPGSPGNQPGGSGGSGVVILKYADAYTITIGAGLTGTTAAPSGGFIVTTITAGTGNVSWA